MPNTPESDLERAVKSNPAWIDLWARSGGPPASHLDPDLLRDAYNEAWNAGHYAGEIAGARAAEVQGGDPGARFGP